MYENNDYNRNDNKIKKIYLKSILKEKIIIKELLNLNLKYEYLEKYYSKLNFNKNEGLILKILTTSLSI